MPQEPGWLGGHWGESIVLTLLVLTVVLAEDAFAEVVATMPVTARARTKQRTMIFMVLLLL
jgi:hypothetical protein